MTFDGDFEPVSGLKGSRGANEIHICNSGGYGFGLREGATPVIRASWNSRLQDWMNDVGMSPAK